MTCTPNDPDCRMCVLNSRKSMYDGKPKDGQLHDGNENKYRETLTLTT